MSEKAHACGATDFGACRARGPTLGATMALLTALLLGGCMQATPHPVWDANFTARDKQQLTNPPYQQAWISPAYQRQVVQYQRKEAPGSILVDTDGRYVYYVLPEGRAIRYGAFGAARFRRPSIRHSGWFCDHVPRPNTRPANIQFFEWFRRDCDSFGPLANCLAV